MQPTGFHGGDDRDSAGSASSAGGRFGRLFPNLPPRAAGSLDLFALGAAGGPMDGGPGGNDNQRIKAGFTFLGQFIDHDITFDPTTLTERRVDPNSLQNFRTPALELDSLYGLGPRVQPYLYDEDLTFLIGNSVNATSDLARNAKGAAIIPDPRNDENMIVGQMHLLFQRFHNTVLSTRTQGSDPAERFEEARRLVRWHYQWMIVHEYLRLIVGDAMREDVFRNGPRFFDCASCCMEHLFLPVEFAVAAFRFGHSQVRSGYGINGFNGGFGASLFPEDPAQVENGAARNSLVGGPVIHAHHVDWRLFFDLPGATPALSKQIDTTLSAPLLNLPVSVVPPSADPRVAGQNSLAVRNLLRSDSNGLPSGETVATVMGETPIPDSVLWQGVPPAVLGDAPGESPLWFYILREAEDLPNGEHLGPVGGRIVAETFYCMLMRDAESYLAQDPMWKPTLGSNEDFTMADLAQFVGDFPTPEAAPAEAS